MAQGNKIISYQTLSSFTVNVPYAHSKRYGTTQSSTTFQVGYQYTGTNLYKNASRPPKIRILAAVKPCLSSTGTPNANNDTYVAYQIYDYTLGRFRGPECGRAADNNTRTYTDYFLVTLDRFGQSIGNLYAGTGYSATTFTAPTVISGVGVYVRNPMPYNNGSASATATVNHADSIWTFGSADKNGAFNQSTIHFNGFFYFDYSANPTGWVDGVYCFYTYRKYPTTGAAYNKQFRHTADRSEYTTGTYPYLAQAKFTSEWRYGPICDIQKALGYTPFVKHFGVGNIQGGIKYVPLELDPNSVFTHGGFSVVDIYSSTNNIVDADIFFHQSHLLYADEQGVDYAPAGWYGTYNENSYQKWTGSAWDTATYNTYSSGGNVVTIYGYNPTLGASDAFYYYDNGISSPRSVVIPSFSENGVVYESDGVTQFDGNSNYFYYPDTDQVFFVTFRGVMTDIQNRPAVTLNAYTIDGAYPDPMEACNVGPGGRQPITVYSSSFTDAGGNLFTDSAGTIRFMGDPGMFYYSADWGFVFNVENGTAVNINPC